MKNIHVLPTDQPSKLYLEYGDGDLCLSNNLLPQTSKSNNQHIYITSDEEIKESDAVIHYFGMGYEVEYPCEPDNLHSNTRKKIILTTDPDLIADGVQAIDDKFLQWFVKNPTCEFVKIESWETKGEWELEYKIKIPQEEPKPLTDEEIAIKLEEIEREEPKQEEVGKCFADNADLVITIHKPKQETLEEAAEKYANKKGAIPTTELEDAIFKQGFIDGANWMAKRRYSEEEVKEIVNKTIEKFYKHRYADKTKAEMKELWFENFKKK